MAFPHVFGSESGSVGASQLDDNFNVCAFASDLVALGGTVAALPSSAIPLIPVSGGSAGVAADLSRSDHQHPPQAATRNAQTGTSYTVQASDNGKVVSLANAGNITVTVANNLSATFNCVFLQFGAGQVTFVAAGGAIQAQRQGFTKTAGIYAVVSLLGVDNSGGSSFAYVLSGDMAA